MFDYTSKINYANPHTNSLKAGIPKEIVKELKLEVGNSMKWEVLVEIDEKTKELKKKVVVSKLEE